jgi:hypothetical protein
MGSYLYCGEAPKEEGIDVLGVFLWAYQRARNFLGEGLGINWRRKLSSTYSSYNLWIY